MHFTTLFSLTSEDRHCILTLVSCLIGIGSLAMAFDFSRAGMTLGLLSLVSMAAVNIYATICLSVTLAHVQALDPTTPLSFSDLGQYCFGRVGKIATQVTHLGTCLTLPIAFYILGGTVLLPGLFKGLVHVSHSTWIFLMAIGVTPIALLRSFKEATWLMAAGSLSTLGAILLAMTQSLTTPPSGPFVPTTVAFHNVVTVFGMMSLAFGAAVIIPTVQREHSSPTAMPKIIMWSLLLMTGVYGLIAVLGYRHYGCNTPSNLLLSMTSGWQQRLAYGLMQGHLMIAMSVLLHPLIVHVETAWSATSKGLTLATPTTMSRPSSPSLSYSVSKNGLDTGRKYEEGWMLPLPRLTFRLSMVLFQAFAAALGQSSFIDVAGLIGATTISGCCVFLPCLFHHRVFRLEMSTYHQVVSVAVMVACGVFGGLTAVSNGQTIIANLSSYRLFASSETLSIVAKHTYPFCPSDYLSLMSVSVLGA